MRCSTSTAPSSPTTGWPTTTSARPRRCARPVCLRPWPNVSTMAPEEAVQASSGGAAPAGAGVLVAGRVIDGFRLEERVHQGGMANLWRVSHPQHDPPLLMKVPRLRPGEDPATIVGFE